MDKSEALEILPEQLIACAGVMVTAHDRIKHLERQARAATALLAQHEALYKDRPQWVKTTERMPPTEPNTDVEFIVAVRRQRKGKVYVFAATYLNAKILSGPELIDGVEPEDYDGPDTVQVTGWYTEFETDGDTCWWNIIDIGSGDEVIAWQALPALPSWAIRRQSEP